MSEELYKAPSFQFYADDFTADTADLTAEELGIYVRLICHQWKQGFVPADTARQAMIGRVSVPAMKRAWKTLDRMFSRIGEHCIQPRLERVRAEAAERHARYVEAGRRGGRPAAALPPNGNQGFSKASTSDNPGLSPAEARDKGIEKGSESSPISDLQDKYANAYGEPRSPKQSRLKVEEPSHLAAWQILDAAWPVIAAQHDLAIKCKDWRAHNKRAAKALADGGKTPDDVVAMLETAYRSEFYSGITTLAKLVEHWPKLAALDRGDEEERRQRVIHGAFLPVAEFEDGE